MKLEQTLEKDTNKLKYNKISTNNTWERGMHSCTFSKTEWNDNSWGNAATFVLHVADDYWKMYPDSKEIALSKPLQR